MNKELKLMISFVYEKNFVFNSLSFFLFSDSQESDWEPESADLSDDDEMEQDSLPLPAW